MKEISKVNILLFCTFVFFSYFSAMAYEESNYQVIETNEIYEIRKYSDRLAVETSEFNQNSGFRKLFNYISGNNKTNQEIKMTTPVTRIEKNGNMTMQFYLPSKFNKENAPIPSRDDVKLLIVEGGYFAVLKYSGRASVKNFITHKNILEKELLKNNISIESKPIRATYDGPFTLPSFRRNEVMFKIIF
tara:strand:+ start:2627 stop:3193 length:567 start_codon:yes stop_codon:yes gene_type:complete